MELETKKPKWLLSYLVKKKEKSNMNLNQLIKERFIENLVIGGAGFIGSNLIDHLIKSGQNVICLDNLSSGTFDNLKHLEKNEQFKFLKHDIRRPITFDGEILKIWHLACPPVPKFYIKEPLSTLDINYKGSINILELARLTNAKILLTSTSEIYGNTIESPQYENMSIDLLTTNPRSCYSEGKRIAETLFLTYQRIYNVQIRIARIFNTYGPRLRVDDGRVVSNFITRSLNNKKIIVTGDGSQTRSFCYIEDLISGLIKLMENNFQYPLNLGNDSEIKIIDLAILIQKITNDSSKIEFTKFDPNEPLKRKPSIALAEKELNWIPKTSLLVGLQKTIDYFKKIN